MLRTTGILAGWLFIWSPVLLAQTPGVDPLSRNLRFTQERGVGVVDIERPNGKGLSHNLYRRFDVGQEGLILNNAEQGSSASSLLTGSEIAGNGNLVNGPASVILNEVTSSTQASALQGTLEVLGTNADVIIANPNGVTCEGCGFLNSNRVTLTTGIPQVHNGVVSGFDVQGGSLVIRNNASSHGLVAIGTRLLDLVSGQLSGTGNLQLGAKSLIQVQQGKGLWNYEEPGWLAANRPALDLSLLGGQRAGSIRLLSSSAGVGVKQLEGVASSSGGFVLTKEGRIRATGSARNARLARTALSSVSASATPANGDTTVSVIDNATVVNIATPTDNLSHNVFTSFNVDAGGLVWNNVDNGTATVAYIPGDPQIQENPNLTSGPAGIILNEVTSTSRSALEGPAEVAGTQADVIIANPNGITCDGCSFFNMNRLVLSTGAPVINNNALDRLDVTQGDITVQGTDGLCAAGVDETALVSRSLAINGPVCANNLRVLAGPIEYNWNAWSSSRSCSTPPYEAWCYGNDDKKGSDTVPVGAAPNYSILLTENGSITTTGFMNLSSYEALPVKIMERTDGSESILAGGTASLVIEGSFLNQGWIHLNAIEDENTPVDEIDQYISANTITNEGVINASNLGLYAYDFVNEDNASILIFGKDSSQEAYFDNTFLNKGTISIVDGSVELFAGDYGDNGKFENRGKIEVVKSGIFYVYADDFKNINSGNDSSLGIFSADALVIRALNGVNGVNANLQADNLSIEGPYDYNSMNFPGAFVNNGSIKAVDFSACGTNLTIGTNQVTGSSSNTPSPNNGCDFYPDSTTGTINTPNLPPVNITCGVAYGTASVTPNTGSVNTDNGTTTATDNSTNTNTNTNTGTDNGTNTNTNTSTNNGTNTNTNTGTTTTTPTIDLSDPALPKKRNGLFVTNTTSSGPLVTVNAMFGGLSLSETGSDYLAEQIGYDPDTTTRRLGDSSYEAQLVRQQLREQTRTGTLPEYRNTESLMKGLMDNAASNAGALGLSYGTPLTETQLAGLNEPILWMVETEVGGLKVLTPKVYLPSSMREDIRGKGAVIAANKATLNVTGLSNAGTIVTDTLDVNSTGDINNTGSIGAQDLSMSSEQNLNNQGELIATNDMNLNAQGDLNNAGTLRAGNEMNLNSASDLNNSGTIEGSNVNLESAGDLNNAGGTVSGETLNLSSTGGSLNNTGTLSATNDLNASAFSDLNNAGTLSGGGNVNLDSTFGGLNNSGTLSAGNNLNVNVQDDINNSGRMAARNNVSLSAEGTQGREIGDSGTGGLNNTGVITAGNDLEVDVKNEINNAGGRLAAGNDLNLTSREEGVTNQGGTLKAGNDLNVDAFMGINNQDGTISSGGDATLTSQRGGFNNQDGTVESRGALSVTTQEDINNTGGRLASGGDLSLASSDGIINNEDGTISSRRNVNLEAGGADFRMDDTTASGYSQQSLNNQGGTIEGMSINVEAEGDIDNQDGSMTAGSINLDSNSGRLNNQEGSIRAGDLAVNVEGDINNQGGNLFGQRSATLNSSEGAFNNQGGTLRGGDLSVDVVGDLNNQDGTIGGTGDVNLTSQEGTLQNEGGIVRGNNVGVSVEGDLVNTADSTLQANNLSLESREGGITNQEATLEASGNLSLKAKDDISNISGTIRGGNVSLDTEGSIINETTSRTEYYGWERGSQSFGSQTVLGQTASIESTGNLSLNAGENIQNTGAQMSAGGDASLNAGGDITFDTIEQKSSSYTSTATGTAGTNGGPSIIESSSSTSTRSTTQIKSGLTVGGDLNSTAGGDTTFAGTDVNAGGDTTIETGGDLNVIARENTFSTSSNSFSNAGDTSRLSEERSNSIRNVGSELNVGNDASLTSGETFTIQGSDVTVGGNAEIDAQNLEILAGRDVDETYSRTLVTDNRMQIETVGGDDSADGTTSKGITFSKTTTTVEESFSQRSVGSGLSIGGNAAIDVEETLTLQGSDVEVGGNLDLQAQDVELLAAQNIEKRTTTTTVTRTGLYGSSDNSAGAEGAAEASGLAEASANAGREEASASAQGSASASGEASTEDGSSSEQESSEKSQSRSGTNETSGLAASASAGGESGAGGSASAASNNTLDVYRSDTTRKETYSLTNLGSAIRSGGNLNMQVDDQLRLQGSEIEAGGDVNLEATDMVFEAVQDKEYTKESKETTRVGLYADAGAEASGEAGANADANAGASVDNSGLAAEGQAAGGGGAQAGAGGEAEAKVGIGIQVKNTQVTTEEGSSTASTSSITAGGNLTRNASNSIVDEGTNLEAGGDFNQSSQTYEARAAENSQYSRTTTEETTVRLGLYAETDGEAEAGASAELRGEASAGTSVPMAEGEANAGAGASAEGGARVGVEATVDRTVSGEETQATQAQVVNIKTGGNTNLSTTEKMTLEGTNLEAEGDVNLSASELEVLAARDTESSTSFSETITARAAASIGVGGEAEAKAGVNKDTGASASADAEGGVQVGVEAEFGYEREDSASQGTNAVVSNLSGNSININTTGGTTLEGTNLEAGEGGININAESLDFQAAQDTFSSTESSTSVGVEAEFKATVIGATGAEGELGVDVEVSQSQESGTNAVVGNINSAGGLNINTTDSMRFEGTQLEVADDTNLSAGGDVSFDAARNTFEASSTDVGVSASLAAGDDGVEEAGLEVSVETSRESSSEAVVSNVNSGGSLNIVSGNDVNFEGTNLASGEDTQIVAMNDVNFREARNTSSSESVSVGVELGYGKDDGTNDLKGTEFASESFEGGAEVGYENEESSEAVTGSISAGNNLNIVSGNDTTLVGTELEAGNAAAISAGGDLNLEAAESTSSSTSVGVEVGASTSTKDTKRQAEEGADEDAEDNRPTKTQTETEGSLGLELGLANATEQQAVSINAGGGGIQLSSGNDLNLEGTQMETEGAAELSAGGRINETDITSTSSEFGLELEASVTRETESGDLGPAPETEKKEAATEEDGDLGLADLFAEPEDSSSTASRSADEPEGEDSPLNQSFIEDDPEGEDSPLNQSFVEDGADAEDDGDLGLADLFKEEDSSAADSKDTSSEPASTEPESETKVKGGLKDLTIENEETTQSVSIDAEGGVTKRQGFVKPQPISGVSMTLKSTKQADGSLKTLVPVPRNLPAGTKVAALLPDGSPLPEWVEFDPETGAVSGTPPEGSPGVNLVVSIPNADGSVRKIGVQFGTTN